MASGIVRASDRVAIWHTAADEPPTSEPPKGASPDSVGQDVTVKPSIPNSNKFKTPANGLKKLLDTIDNGTDDKAYYGPNAHPKLNDWLTAHPDFTKTYFKPGYADALKAHLGAENYEKLYYHAPVEHAHALITHQQQPAPNSNKFKTPANGLKKLLENPHTTAEHVKTWTDSHEGFAKGYLNNPEYVDALKGHLGAGAWNKLQVIQEAGKAKPAGTPDPQQVKDNLQNSFAPTFKPQTQEQALAPEEDEWEQQLLEPQPKAEEPNSPHYDSLKAQAAPQSPVGQAMEDPVFHGWFHSHTKEDQAGLSNSPAEMLKKFTTWKSKHPNEVGPAPTLSPEDQSESDAVKKLIPKIEVAKPPSDDEDQFQQWAKSVGEDSEHTLHGKSVEELHKGWNESSPEEKKDALDYLKSDYYKQQIEKQKSPGVGPQHPALLGDIKKVFPSAEMEGKTDEELKAQLESWLKFLPDHEGFKDHVPKLQAVYDKWFGGKPSVELDSPPPPESFTSVVQPEDQAILDKDKAAQPDEYQDLLDKINTIKPGWIKQKSWLEAMDKADALQKAIAGWAENGNLTSEEQAEFKKLLDQQKPVDPWLADSEPDLQYKHNPDFKAWFISEIDDSPGAWTDFDDDQKKNLFSQYQEEDNQDDDDDDSGGTFLDDLGHSDPDAKPVHQQLNEAYKAAFPKSYPHWDDDGSPEAMQKHLQELIDTTNAKEVKQKLQGVYDQVFGHSDLIGGGDPWNSDAEGMKPVKFEDLDGPNPFEDSHGVDGSVPINSEANIPPNLLVDGDGANPVLKPGVAQMIHDHYLKSMTQNTTPEAHKKTVEESYQDGDWKILGTEWNDLSADDKKAYLKQPLPEWAKGGKSPEVAPQSTPFDAKTLGAEMGKLTGIGPEVTAGGVAYSKMTPEQAKAALQKGIDKGGFGHGLKGYQDLYDKYFGDTSGGDAQGAQGTGVKSVPNTPQDMLAPDGTYSQMAIDYMKHSGWPVPGEKTHHESWTPSSWNTVLTQKPSDGPADYVPWETFKQQHGGEPTPAAAPATTFAPASDDLEKLFDDGKLTINQYQILQKKSDDWWKEHWEGVGEGSSSLWKNLFSIKPGVSGGSVSSYKPGVDFAKEVLEATDWASNPEVANHGGIKFKDMTPDQAKDALKWFMESDSPVWSKNKSKIQALYDKYFGGAAAPSGPPPFDPKGFVSEFKSLFPGSSWATDGEKTPEEAEAKLKGMVQAADENFPDTDKTQQAHVLYDKYFGSGIPAAPKAQKAFGEEEAKYGPGAPTGGEAGKYPPPAWISEHYGLAWTPEKIKQSFDDNPSGMMTKTWVNDKHGDKAKFVGPTKAQESEEEELEDPSEVSTPFKTEEAKPEDIAKWAAGKPASAVQWKQFAQWWGNNKIPPEQEQLLYNTWFPSKDVPADFATKWFGQVFEHHSVPSGGDLGLEQPPSWAHSSWAFGDKADKDWPMFAQWAAKDPGIPKDMSVKQKLAIWKGLSVGDKKEIQENYNPSSPVDAPSVVGALSSAYPDSDWSKWSTMPQGTLKNNVEMLAKSGYPKAIPVFNQYFGGKIPVPKEKPEAEEEPTPEPMKVIPVSKLPEWVTNYWGSDEDSAKKYTQLKKFADAIGQGKLAEEGDPKKYNNFPDSLAKQWNLVPDHLKDALSAAPTMPFHSPEEFTAWLDAQPKPKDELDALYPDSYSLKNANYWGHPVGYPKSYQKNAIETFLNTETDPLKKSKVLDIYYKYYGGNKPTMAQSLKDIYPDQDWDKLLKNNDKETVAKLLKKQLKTETNPEKWIALVDTWGKYLNANSGVKQVTNALKGQQTGNPVDPSTLKELYYWKTQLGGSPSAPKPDYWTVKNYDHDSAYIKTHATKSGDNTVLPYYGWTPPGHKGGGYVADPAQLATFGPTYTAPPEEKKGKQLQTLMDTMEKKKVGFSKADRDVAKSGEFANWFQAAPSAYRSVFQSNPGIAIDDFKAFMTSGDIGGTDQIPQGDGKTKTYDPSAYWAQPYTKGQDSSTVYFGPNNPVKVNPKLFPAPEGSYGDPGHWPGFTKNPKSKDKARPHLDWDEVEDEPGQFPIPLPPGENWEPERKNEVLHRGVNLSLSVNVPDMPSQSEKKNNPEYYARMMAQRAKALKMRDLADDIRHSIKGSSDTTLGDLFNTAPTDAPEVPLPSGKWNNSYGPQNAGESMAFMKWVKDNGVGAEQLYTLAKKWKVPNPNEYGLPGLKETPGTGFATPKFVHIDGLPDAPAQSGVADPDLARKILDLMELKGKYDSTGLGDHWSRKFDVSDQKFTSQTASDDLIPVLTSADWSGLGEHPGRPDAAWGYDSEHEINLTPGAPVQVHRVQIRLPGHGSKLIDLPVERHMRHASMAPMTKLADLEEVIEILATSMEDEDHWSSSAPMAMGSPLFPQQGWDPSQSKRPVLKGDPAKHRYFSPHEVNPRADTTSRPNVQFPAEKLPQDTLEGMPKGHGTVPLYRGLGITEPNDAMLNAVRSGHPDASKMILDHLDQGHGGLGSHWSTDPERAKSFAHQQSGLPVVMRADWKGTGEDPYRNDTGGDYPSEREMTMLPGAQMSISGVSARHPDTLDWHDLPMGAPSEHAAATDPIRTMEAQIQRLCDEADRKSEAWLYG